MKYTLKQLQTLAASTGFPDPAMAAAIAMAESGGNPCAQGDPNTGDHSCAGPNGTSTSFGLWQINTTYNPQYDAKKLLDPNYNAKAALEVSRKGTVWTPWSTYKNGAYAQYYGGAVYPPGANTPVSPPPVSPPAKWPGVLASVVGVTALITAGGYGLYRAFTAPPSRSFPGRRLGPPEPDFNYRSRL